MATKMENLAALVGQRIRAVVHTKNPSHDLEHGYLVLDDDTNVEIYIRDGGIAKLWKGGVGHILVYSERNDHEVEGVWGE